MVYLAFAFSLFSINITLLQFNWESLLWEHSQIMSGRGGGGGMTPSGVMYRIRCNVLQGGVCVIRRGVCHKEGWGVIRRRCVIRRGCDIRSVCHKEGV